MTIKDGLLSFKVADHKSSSYKLSIFPIGIDISIEVITRGEKWVKKHENKYIQTKLQCTVYSGIFMS